MVKKLSRTSGSCVRSWGTYLLSLPAHLAPSLPHRGLALALAATATLATGTVLVVRPGPLRGAAAPTPTAQPVVALASRQMQPVQPGYLVSRGSPPAVATPPQVTSRGGERPTASPAPPTPTPEPKKVTTYRVVAGDSVAGLAERWGISAETIVWANSLGAGAALQPGQELTILPVSGALHKVRPGDTLNGIAQAYGVGAGAIVETNALASPDQLAIDQPLVIPGGRPLPPPTPRPTAAPAPTAAPEPAAAAVEVSPEAAGKGAEIVAIAARYLGYAYVYGGSSPRTGFDCSGFAQWVYGQAGISISRVLSGQLAGGPAVQRADLLPGDLVFFRDTYTAGLSHVGIYVGGGSFIHASSPGRGVCYDAIGGAYWAARYYAASRPWQ